MTTMTLNLTIPDDAWTECGWNGPENADRLLTQVCVNGTMHHLEAYRATVGEDGCVVLSNPEMEAERMPKLQGLYDGAYQLTPIRGHDYVVFMFPHAD
jgi:hypothetical protein